VIRPATAKTGNFAITVNGGDTIGNVVAVDLERGASAGEGIAGSGEFGHQVPFVFPRSQVALGNASVFEAPASTPARSRPRIDCGKQSFRDQVRSQVQLGNEE
jgi:hypothetical protein